MMLDKELENILNDSTSGSTDILKKLIQFFISYPEKLDSTIITYLINHFSTFQIIKYFLTELQKFILSKNESEIRNFLQTFLMNAESHLTKLFNNALPFLMQNQKFVTISNSKTLLFVFSEYYKIQPNLEVTILESRPVFEGRILAEKLSNCGITTNLITDSMASNSVENCNAVVIGADNIHSNGDVINKTGSRNLAILCKYFNKPFYVIADKTKFSKDSTFEKDSHNPSEIWASSPNKIKITNYYFEKIEAELISEIIFN